MSVILALRRLKQKYHKFKAIVDCIESSKPARAMQKDLVSNTHTQNQNQNTKKKTLEL